MTIKNGATEFVCGYVSADSLASCNETDVNHNVICNVCGKKEVSVSGESNTSIAKTVVVATVWILQAILELLSLCRSKEKRKRLGSTHAAYRKYASNDRQMNTIFDRFMSLRRLVSRFHSFNFALKPGKANRNQNYFMVPSWQGRK